MLSERQKHLDEECGFVNVKCTFIGCREMIQRRDLLIHQNICQNRKVPCEHCHRQVIAERLVAHINVCDHVSIVCPHGCKIKYMRRDKTEHELTCSHVPIACPMASVGCRVKVNRKDMDQHMASDLMTHMELIGKHAALESHHLEWTVPDIRTKFTEVDILHSKSITTGLFKLTMGLEFDEESICLSDDDDEDDDEEEDTTFIGFKICIKGADGITQKLPEKLSLEGSQVTFVHPIDSSKSFSNYLGQSSIVPVGRCLGFRNFMTKERCLAEFVWPDGSLHVKAIVKFPRVSYQLQE